MPPPQPAAPAAPGAPPTLAGRLDALLALGERIIGALETGDYDGAAGAVAAREVLVAEVRGHSALPTPGEAAPGEAEAAAALAAQTPRLAAAFALGAAALDAALDATARERHARSQYERAGGEGPPRVAMRG